MRLIDADAFDRDLVNAEFTAALNDAADQGKPFENKPMYYSTQSIRDVLKYRPTVEAVPLDQLAMLLAWLFHGCPANAHPSNEHVCHPMCSDELRKKYCSGSCGTDEDRWRSFLSEWMAGGMEVPDEMHIILENQME